jgi:hypothetical protein
MSEGWIQFLLVAVPVLSLIGSWLALKTYAERRQRRHNQDEEEDGDG